RRSIICGMKALVVALTLSAALAHAAPPSAARLSWMTGRWTGIQDGLQMEETWTTADGGALLGMHKDVKDGRMVSFEFLRIDQTPAGPAYLASPMPRPPVPFAVVTLEERRVIFANDKHDFPQRILYWLDDKGALHARIEGTRNGKTKGEEWTWVK